MSMTTFIKLLPIAAVIIAAAGIIFMCVGENSGYENSTFVFSDRE